jgi:hypothetical protein
MFFSELSVFPCQFHCTGAPLLVKLGKKLLIFIIGLHKKPYGCGESVASAACSFTMLKNDATNIIQKPRCYQHHTKPSWYQHHTKTMMLPTSYKNHDDINIIQKPWCYQHHKKPWWYQHHTKITPPCSKWEVNSLRLLNKSVESEILREEKYTKSSVGGWWIAWCWITCWRARLHFLQSDWQRKQVQFLQRLPWYCLLECDNV